LNEHQSSPDFSLPIRLAQSRIEIWHQWLRQNPGKALPIVLSLVFYTGGQAYPYSLRLRTCWPIPAACSQIRSPP